MTRLWIYVIKFVITTLRLTLLVLRHILKTTLRRNSMVFTLIKVQTTFRIYISYSIEYTLDLSCVLFGTNKFSAIVVRSIFHI